MHRHAAIEIGIRLLLDRQLNATTHRTAANILGSAIYCLHNPRATAGHYCEPKPGNCCSHLTCQFVMRSICFLAGGTKNGHAGAHKVQDAKSSQKIPDHAQESDEFVEAGPWSFQKQFISSLGRHSQGGAARGYLFNDGRVSIFHDLH